MNIVGLDHIAFVVRSIDETVARAGDIADGRAVGERFVSDDIDLQVLLFGETQLELIEVRAPGFGMPKLKDGETAVIGHLGIEVDDLEDAKADLAGRGVVLQGGFETDESSLNRSPSTLPAAPPPTIRKSALSRTLSLAVRRPPASDPSALTDPSRGSCAP
jgi:methylmalonyl-CoA/ethylmalonyl-CoA epimerase